MHVCVRLHDCDGQNLIDSENTRVCAHMHIEYTFVERDVEGERFENA